MYLVSLLKSLSSWVISHAGFRILRGGKSDSNLSSNCPPILHMDHHRPGTPEYFVTVPDATALQLNLILSVCNICNLVHTDGWNFGAGCLGCRIGGGMADIFHKLDIRSNGCVCSTRNSYIFQG